MQKYRHYLYEWLGVSKVELSVMIELLLRGEQTVGDLRGRASRMDPIDDLNALRELLTSLKEKGLVIPLTPDGRGQVFTHARCTPSATWKTSGQDTPGMARPRPNWTTAPRRRPRVPLPPRRHIRLRRIILPWRLPAAATTVCCGKLSMSCAARCGSSRTRSTSFRLR